MKTFHWHSGGFSHNGVALDLRTSGFMLLALISDIKDIKGYIFTC